MIVRAKLVVQSITENLYGSKCVNFSAQYDTSIPEDRRFQKATPAASAEFYIDNPAALEQFKLDERDYSGIYEFTDLIDRFLPPAGLVQHDELRTVEEATT